MTDSISALWVQQHQDAVAPDPAALAAADARLRRKLWRRDAIEYAAGALGMGIFVHTGIQSGDWGVRLACAAILLGMGVTLYNLWRRRPRPPAFEASGTDFYRALLVAQRDATATVWKWYIAPVVPGLVLFVIAIALAASAFMPLWRSALVMGVTALPVAGVFWGIHRLNRGAARRLQQMIDALDRGEIA